VLLKAEAARFIGCELKPAVAVAVPVGGKLNNPRIVPPPFTSSVDAGFVVPIPSLAFAPVPNWNNPEFPRVVLFVQMGMKFVVPEPLTLAPGSAPGVADATDSFALPVLAGC
jgi:hypothetical protein